MGMLFSPILELWGLISADELAQKYRSEEKVA